MLQTKLDHSQTEARRALLDEFAEDGVFDILFMPSQVWLCTSRDVQRNVLRDSQTTVARFSSALRGVRVQLPRWAQTDPWVESQEFVDAIHGGQWSRAVR
jgi:hypothetical protein